MVKNASQKLSKQRVEGENANGRKESLNCISLSRKKYYATLYLLLTLIF